MYFRYADDQMILLNDPDQMESLMLLLTRRLDHYGLRVNQKKVDLWQAIELEQHRCRAIQTLFAQKGDNKKPLLVRKFVDAYLAIPKNDLEKTWNRGIPLLNRLLWANLESLPKNLFERIVTRLTSEQYLLLADQKKLEQVHKLNRRRSQPIDLANRLKQLGEKSIHNAYHYEALAFAILIKDEELKTYCESRLASLEQQMNTCEIS
jgi:hypothetical protein